MKVTRLLPPGRYYHFTIDGIADTFSCRDTCMAASNFALLKRQNPGAIVKIRVTNSPWSN